MGDRVHSEQIGGKQDKSVTAERRALGRKRVLMTGVIAYNQGVHAVDCTIRDLTAHGARVAFSRSQPIPPAVWLINVRERMAYDTRVCWRHEQDIGLAFLRTLNLGDIDDPSLGFLRRLWLSKAAR